jgi:hypothetical protein
VPEDGYVIVTLKDMDFPELEAVMERVLPEKEAVTEEGLGGKAPSSMFWNS